MPSDWIEPGIQWILALQSLGDWLAAPMRAITFLGNEEFYLLVAPVIYWCISATLGLRMGLYLMVSAGLNSAFKLLLHGPRPFWVSSEVKALVIETSFGVPSGHSQNAVVVWSVLAQGVKRSWAWVAAALIILLLGVSRMYLAVHYPADVITGWSVGLLLLLLLLRLEAPLARWLAVRTPGDRALAALVASMVMIILGSLARLSLAGWEMPLQWLKNASLASPGEAINPYALDGLIANAGAFFGLAAGAIWIQSRRGFSTSGPLLQRALRYLVGVIGVFALWYGLGKIFPRQDDLLSYGLRYIRYALVGLWVTGLAPALFVRLGLASAGEAAEA
jgi:membrane-associated phospholipid phosphatase